ncbi:TonB-dependent receptor domain-containing protein [Pollutimonas bauzanensis]|uniref:Heme acquisition protein HasR n=1 Tax=Pollutimonas bauzanensis TaxID=658167 RepID=A0A1M5ZN56_9BURK|nr:TonB-dependent receptor [Pollutimonas bauzanensis]SHI25598.1 heme acquisition protein HasR [Pollutimonas bauzanensis]
MLEKDGTGGARMRPSWLWLAMMLALGGSGDVLAQEAAPAPKQGGSTMQQADSSIQTLEAVEVTGTAEEEKKTGVKASASKEDIERRNASHMSDLIEQISGTSVNSLYARPEVSVGVQGIAGHGRVSQSLEGINQNFHAFTRDIGQTGSIFVDPQFLKSIDVNRGGSTGTGALGSLGSSVDFRYLDLEDILRPGKNFGGMVRGSAGFSEYRNGQKPSGSFFLGGRDERWEWMLGAAQSKNDAYRIGRSFNREDMLNDADADNIKFYGNMDDAYAGADSNCRYRASGLGGMGAALSNCQFTPFQLDALKEAAGEPLSGTQKKNDAQMLRLRHYFDDTYDQRLELFATASGAKYETDQQPSIRVPFTTEAGSRSRWEDYPWSVRAELESQVVSLKYSGNFNDWLNPEAQLYHEKQNRKQRWTGYPGTYSAGEALHYFADIGSTGLKLSNTSHFDTALAGPLKLDAGLELRRADKKVDSLSDAEFYEQYMRSVGNTSYKSEVWDPDSRNDALGLALTLGTEGGGPWQASGGVGWQRVWLDVENPRFTAGNIKKGGLLYSFNYYYEQLRAQGVPRTQARQMATEMSQAAEGEFRIDPESGFSNRLVEGEQKHHWDLRSAHFALAYSPPNTGITTYAQVGYSERAPTSNEMYMGGPWLKTGFTANPSLEPEKALSFNLGMNYQSKDWLANNDQINVGINYYRNRIRNYIVYGPIIRPDESVGASYQTGNGMVANVNNLNDYIRHGLELNLSYRQQLFYIRGNFTLPIRHDNKVCAWESPSGSGYRTVNHTDGTIEFMPYGNKGEKLCYSSWNWMEAGAVEPIRGSLTAALTPGGGQWELGGTVHYRGKQRATYWFDSSLAYNQTTAPSNSTGALPEKSDFITASLWPKVIKVDLFANYRFNDDLKVGIYLANLTDQMDATTTTFGYNFYPGRMLTANLEYRF